MRSNVLNGIYPFGTIPSESTTPTSGVADNPMVVNGSFYYKNKLVNPGGSALQSVLFVAKSGDDSGDGTFSAPFETIQKAIDTAEDGFQINVLDSGNYNENLVNTDKTIYIDAPYASLIVSFGDGITHNSDTNHLLIANFKTVSAAAGYAVTTGGAGTASALARVILNCYYLEGDLLSDSVGININAEVYSLDYTVEQAINTGFYKFFIKNTTGTITVEDETTVDGRIGAELYGIWMPKIEPYSFLVSFTELSGGKVLLPSLSDRTYRVHGINLSSTGINFSGGDRSISIANVNNTVFFTTIPAATAQALVNATWGSTDVPFPTANGMTDTSTNGLGIRIIQSGGTSDYTSGELNISLLVETVRI